MSGDRDDIANLLAAYCHYCDDGDFDGLLDCFMDDATFAFEQWEATGRDQLRRWFERNQSPDQRGKHLTTNSVIEVDGDRATARSDFMFLGRVDGRLVPLIAGRYLDDIRRVDGHWRFCRRTSTKW
jgi:3-phenylpropionate/cinnamic acid dioxygenase small subunit